MSTIETSPEAAEPEASRTETSRPWERRFRGIRVLRVLRTRAVTPGMRRITLGGPEMAALPEGPVIKLLVPPPGVSTVAWPAAEQPLVWPAPALRPAVRTYSVRRHDPAAGELDVDFVLHGHGPAATWAAAARAGDPVGISHPGGRTIAPAAWSCIAGDHTAVPGIAALLEAMPRDARGHAVIAVPDPAEEQPIDAPPGVTVTWLYRGGPRLADAVRALPWPEGEDVAVWVGAESEEARAIRAYVRDARGVHRRRVLVVGYWRRGLSETAYGEAFDHDRDADYFAVARDEERATSARHAPEDHDHAP